MIGSAVKRPAGSKASFGRGITRFFTEPDEDIIDGEKKVLAGCRSDLILLDLKPPASL